MNLKSLFQLLRLPKKGGKETIQKREIQILTGYSLNFINLEDAPSYELETSLSVGSEVGEIVIEDSGLSPRHAIFELENNVVTVMDFGSATGTFISNHQITKGKKVILQDGDIVKIGDVQVQLVLEEIEQEAEVELLDDVEEESEVSEETTNKPISDESEDEQEEQVEEGEDEVSEIQDRIKKMRAKNENKPPTKKVLIAAGVQRAANALPRLIAFILDVLWVIIVWIIMSPFDDFKVALEVLPNLMVEHVVPFIQFQVEEFGVKENYDEIVVILADLFKEAEAALSLSSFVSLFVLWRITWAFILGVSLGQWMSGIRAYGSALWKRGGGVLREMFGLITWIFILPDISTVFSKRSLKEILTRTHLYNPSKGSIIISWLIFFPITLVALISSPMFTGLELPMSLSIRPVLESKKQVKAPEQVLATVSYESAWFGVKLDLSKENWLVTPRFSWAQTEKGSVLRPALMFQFNKETIIPVVLEKVFDWNKMIDLALAHNPPLQKSFPQLWSYVQSNKIQEKKMIKYNPTAPQKLQFETELLELINIAFKLEPETLVDHILTYGPLIKGLMEFRSELLYFMNASEGGEWSLERFGKAIMLVYEVSGVKPFDLFIPLAMGKGRVFKISYSSEKDKRKSMKLAKNELWSKSLWRSEDVKSSGGILSVIDTFANFATTKRITSSKVEKVFESFFEEAARLVDLPAEDGSKISMLKSIKNIIEVVNRFSKIESEDDTKELMVKLKEKMTEMYRHLESGNVSYFKSNLG
jgi:hypothetical protein